MKDEVGWQRLPWRDQGLGTPLVGRIVTVADVFDALTHELVYKMAWPVEEAPAEIELQSGRQFDPRMAEAFLSLHMQSDPAT